MPKRSSNRARKRVTKSRPDVNEIAHWIVTKTTGAGAAHVKNPHAVALGKLGGPKGGPARAKALSAERRREIALKAARARWETDRTIPSP